MLLLLFIIILVVDVFFFIFFLLFITCGVVDLNCTLTSISMCVIVVFFAVILFFFCVVVVWLKWRRHWKARKVKAYYMLCLTRWQPTYRQQQNKQFVLYKTGFIEISFIVCKHSQYVFKCFNTFGSKWSDQKKKKPTTTFIWPCLNIIHQALIWLATNKQTKRNRFYQTEYNMKWQHLYHFIYVSFLFSFCCCWCCRSSSV